ncbi:hypothetical protein BBJ29_008060 [Phytophthora kernoviae]|uniref:Elicitin-like protein n=1 Tax=Phytophthora kernoviae TaxID=325452 RepID=A0A3F2RC57_9STRA|nr:hypothetical protein BBP00_00009673 [Phytophthora kernoviae]RLN70655.1 hypothetical protein BBJ29_008060 [Phytophthora kernoviae]
MQSSMLLTLFVAAVAIVTVSATENCTDIANKDVFQSLKTDSNYAACKTDTNITQPTSVAPLTLGILPDCEVVTSRHTFKLPEVIAAIVANCASSTKEFLNLQERAVGEGEMHNQIQHVSENILHILGHAIPMEEFLL